MSRWFAIAVLFAIIALLFPAACFSAGERKECLEIVESVPAGTTLDVPEVRNVEEVWLEMLRGARESIDIEHFYFAYRQGEPQEKVLQAIGDAAARGVKVRIITDDNPNFRKETMVSCKMLEGKKNIEWKWIRTFDAIKGVQHSKYFIIDREEVYLGSQNVDWRSMKHISEVGVRIRHKDYARVVCDLFDLDWKLCDLKDPKESASCIPKKSYAVPFHLTDEKGELIEFCPAYDPKGYLPDEKLWEEPALLSLMKSAKKEIMLQVLTYSPISREKEFYCALDCALREAASRGVKVRIVVSDWNTRMPDIAYLKSLSLVPNVELKISTIPRYEKGFIPYARVQHSKYLIVDDRACWIGSSNWEKGYFYNCRNLGVVIKGADPNAVLRKIFFTTWESSYAKPIDVMKVYQAPKQED
jgi:phosphatidylserine/phosphatidylglycerophosphate/cardiolipin synthase-like enzyme